MTKLDFSTNLQAPLEKLTKLFTEYEKFPLYLPQQLKSVIILEKNDTETLTIETILFSTFFKKSFEQKSRHIKVAENHFRTEILSGPAKGTIVNFIFEKIDSGTTVSGNIDLKLTLTAKLLSPIIKRWYKRIIQGVLLKMNSTIINE